MSRRWWTSVVVAAGLMVPSAAWADGIEAPAPVEGTGIESVEIPSTRTLTLEQAMEQGRRANPDMALARTRLESARLLQSQAWSTLIPDFKASAIYTRYDQEISFDLGGAFPTDPNAPPTPAPEPQVIRPLDEFRFTGTISSVFDPRIFPLLENALLAEDIALLSQSDLKREIDYAVSQLYFQLLTLEALQEIQLGALESQNVLLEAAKGRKEAGAGTEFEITRAMTELTKAQGELERTRVSYLSVRRALAQLIVTEADFKVEAPAQMPVPKSAQEMVDQARRARPDLSRADLNVQVAQNDLTALYWTYAPTLVAQFNATAQQETAFNPQAFTWNIQLILSWTLYDGGLREARIDDAELKVQESVIMRDKLDREITTAISQAFDDLRGHQILLETSEREIELAKKALEQAQDGYKLGALPQLEVINAELVLRIARVRQATYMLDYRLAVRNIYRLAGQN